ncbi:MAG TPA: ketoacyl-ACP synthase III [Burkholderiales bacterium]|nr:ketoacyl-ACP synthase III [Burkholderiales bacterium]
MTLTATIAAIDEYLPAAKLSNQELSAQFPDWPPEKILEKTGIELRGVAGPDECASDLGFAAARKLFERGVVRPEEIDFLLFCSQAPDYILPTTACLLQERLGLPTTCGALDLNLGCSGFVYGLSLAKGLIESNGLRNVLLITADTYSKFIHPLDKSVRTVFGDGAAATLIRAVESDQPALGPFEFGSDGRGAQHLIVPAGGFRQPRSAATALEQGDSSGNVRSADHLYMNGPEIMQFTLKNIPPLCQKLAARAGIALDQVDYFVFHQASAYMLETLRKKIRIAPEKFSVCLRDVGNTVSSTIPISLKRDWSRGAIKSGNLIMLVGFGVGYSWAATLCRIHSGEL